MADKYLEVFESLTEEQACERTFVGAHPAALCLTKDTRRVIFGGRRYNSARAIRMCAIDALAEGKNLATIKRNCDTFRVEDEDGNFCSTLLQYVSRKGNRTVAVQILIAYQDDGAVYEIRTCPIDDDLLGTQFGPWSLVNREMRDIVIDSHLSETSANTVQNAAITNEIKRFEGSMNEAFEEYKNDIEADFNGFKTDVDTEVSAHYTAVDTRITTFENNFSRDYAQKVAAFDGMVAEIKQTSDEAVSNSNAATQRANEAAANADNATVAAYNAADNANNKAAEIEALLGEGVSLDYLTNEEIDDIFVGSFKIVDGYLVGDGTYENGILTTNMKVEDGYVII